MKKALLYISYHPGSISDYEQIREKASADLLSVLVLCKHPYLNSEIIDLYSKKFDRLVILPEVNYKLNILSGYFQARRFRSYCNNQMKPVLEGIENFTVISDCSAYLPVNLFISAFKRDKRCRELISIRQDYNFSFELDFLKSLWCFFYSLILNINFVWCHKRVNYLYWKEPRDRAIRIVSPFDSLSDIKKAGKPGPDTFLILRSKRLRSPTIKDTVVIYSDRQLDSLGFDINSKENNDKLTKFYNYLFNYYKDCEFICKPHPQDKGSVMPGLDSSRVKVYNGGLTSQAHMDTIIERVKACYAAISTSVFYPASLGVPSYVFYKHLGIDLPYLSSIYENKKAGSIPLVFNLREIDEIGCIDDRHLEATEIIPETNLDSWLNC